jgi:CheY-like chemotaxis protein
MLQRTGHQVTTVRTSDEALEQMGEQSFDLFLLGCADQAGLRLCQKLRQVRPDKPIIFYSTTALFSQQQEGQQAGASAYLAKPEDLFNVGQIASDLISSQTRLAPRLIRAA